MKKFLFILISFFCFSCDSSKSWQCVQTSGVIIEREIPLPEFDKVIVGAYTHLFLQQGPEQKVIVKTGQNLAQNIEFNVTNNRLEITNKNNCNWIRDYENVEVYITSPQLSEIRNSSGYAVESLGVLNYPSLKLISENTAGDFQNDGDFHLSLHLENLEIVANGTSAFYLTGEVSKAQFGLFSGDCRIYAEGLIIDDLQLFHRSTGPMVINPQHSIEGKIVSLGNVLAKNRPPIVEVEELYRGKLIFE